MKEQYQRYIDQAAEVQRLARPQLSPGLSREELVAAIRDNAQQIFRIRKDNDRLLDQLIFSRRPEDLTPEDVADLEEFADGLSRFNQKLDNGAAHYVHRLLYDYARLHEDRALCIRELYYLGLTLHYMNQQNTDAGVNLFGAQVSGYFTQGAAYLDQYEELDRESRGFVIRCLANRRLGMEAIQGPNSGQSGGFEFIDGYPVYSELFYAVMAVITSPKYREMDPDLPWESFEYAMHSARTSYLSALRSHYDPDIARDVLESAEFVYRCQERLDRLYAKTITAARVRYCYHAARYHAGLISIVQLLEELLAIQASGNPDDFSDLGVFTNLMMPAYIMVYAEDLRGEERARFEPRVRRALDGQMDYLRAMPAGEHTSLAANYIRDMALSRLQNDSDKGVLSGMLGYIMAAHQPTYVHSRVVAYLTRLLCGQTVDLAPELLVGVLGTESPEEVRARREEVCALAERCGLYHDIGKNMVLDDVVIYGRRLLDEEFACIKEHTWMGYYLLSSFEELGDMAQAALHHHRFYNDKGGYLLQYPPCSGAIRAIVDMVTVADSIDAATDNVGRSYAQTKTFAQLVEELRAGSGTRYAPAVVSLLDDEGFYASMERGLASTRERIYYEVYLGDAAREPV